MANLSISGIPSLPSNVAPTDLFLISRPIGGGLFTTYNGSAAQIFAGLAAGPTIIGGSINNTPIGNTTPSTGAFTALSATGALNVTGASTLSGTVTTNALNGTNIAASGTLSAAGVVSGAGFTGLFASPPPVGSTVANTGAFTTLTATSTISGTGFSTYLASPPAIGGTAAAAGSFTTLAASGAVSGAGITARFAAPGPIGSTTPNSVACTTLAAGNPTPSVASTPFMFSGGAVAPPVPNAVTMQISGADGASAIQTLLAFGGISAFRQLASGGTATTPTALVNATIFGTNTFGGYDGTTWAFPAAQIRTTTSETWTASAHGTTLSLLTTPSTTTTLLTLVVLDAATSAVALGGAIGAESLNIPNVASAVNKVQISGSAATAPVLISAVGTDTNIPITITPKGSSLLKIGNAASFSANAAVATVLGSVGPTGSHTTVQKWLTIVDSGGVTGYIPIF